MIIGAIGPLMKTVPVVALEAQTNLKTTATTTTNKWIPRTIITPDGVKTLAP